MKSLDVLIGCEESQAVCKEFRRLGHNAFSCDLKDCSGGHPEWHIKGDVIEAIISRKWDFIGLHPTCTKMTLSGNRHYAPGKPRHQERLDAVEWTIKLWELACEWGYAVYMENPMGAMNGDKRLPVPQIIQPYYFGDEFQKTTCLWLKNIPFLYHNSEPNLFDSEVTHVSKGDTYRWTDDNGNNKAMNYFHYLTSLLPHSERTGARSKTFPGIAKAMAEQWSEYLINLK